MRHAADSAVLRPVNTLLANDSSTTSSARSVLVIEASSADGSVAVFGADGVCAHRLVAMGPARDDTLFPAVMAVMESAGLGVADLSAIVCGSGPGSFTSLRIAAAIAKGLAHAGQIRLFAVPSLLLAAVGAPAGQYLVHSDALRGERYTLAVTINDTGLARADGPVERVAAADVATHAGGRVLLSVGAPPLDAPSAVVRADAASLAQVADWRAFGATDVASWEPAYGRLAEAQVKWEAAHQRPLSSG